MGQRRKPGVTRDSAEQEMRDQEVLRANRELAAYFKGGRTEREARAALKIIKAFVRDRERRGAGNCPPLPGADLTKASNQTTSRTPASADGERARRKPRRKPRDKARGVTASTEPAVNPVPRELPESVETGPIDAIHLTSTARSPSECMMW